MITVEGLKKYFRVEEDEVKAIDNIDFQVSENEFFTLLGPSGSGKSTVLRCLAGLERPDGGKITIGDKIVFSASNKTFLPPNERNISMVFQSYAIWPHMTTLGNVIYPLIGKMPKKEANEKARESLRMVGMQELADRPAPLLSGGQQQRVALARAISKGAKVLLLDEPLSNLDAKLRQNMRIELRELQKRLSITAVYVTHDQEEALCMSDRIAVVNEGKIIEISPPLEIYQRPKSQFVANFIGLCNFLPGRLVSNTNQTKGIAETSIGKIECTIANMPTNKSILIAIRPEYINISDQPIEENRNVFEGLVISKTFLGRIFDSLVKVGDVEIRVEIPSSQNVREGEMIYLYFTPDLCIAIPN